jgi:DNA-binding CsgD family transcriptional regulator
LWALKIAGENGGAAAALTAAGIDLPEAWRFEGVAGEFGDLLGQLASEPSLREMLALGLLAGRPAHERKRTRGLQDPTYFVMDQDLVVQHADGESILRLPWFENGLFVGRQLPDILEMPAPVRRLCVENYSAGLTGERGRFAFSSYGHAYSVEAVPVRGVEGGIEAVLAVATPDPPSGSAAESYERMAERHERAAAAREERAERHRLAGQSDRESAARREARKARVSAEQARDNANRLRTVDAPSLTPRETEILALASHGLTAAEIGEELFASPATVKKHLQHSYRKLGAPDRAAAVATALRHGLIE